MMKDTLTITFVLAGGKTAQGQRSEWHLIEFVLHEPADARLDPSREDLGIGNILDHPEVIAVNVAWLDDYDDQKEPVLAITGVHRVVKAGSPQAKLAAEVTASAVKVPYHPSGPEGMEWIAAYMQDNVYHQDDLSKGE